MARLFDRAGGVNGQVLCAAGAGGSLSGAFTMAAIVRRNANSLGATFGILVVGGETTATHKRLFINGSDQLSLRSNNATANSGATTVTTTTGWCLVAATKASGSSTPRFHVYNYATNSWAHVAGSTALGDSTPSGAVYISGTQANTNHFSGDIALCGTFAAELSDAQVEGLAYGLNAWWQVQPNGLWILDQSDIAINVADLSGGGANQSSIIGTSVSTSSVPVFSYGASIILPIRPQAVTVTGTSATTNANDTSTASGGYGPSGTSATTNANDTATASGIFGTVTTTTTSPPGGSGRPANPRAQALREQIALRIREEDDEILCLL